MTHLDLSDNEVCKIENYRDLIYGALPNLEVLDGKDKEGGSYISFDGEDYGEEGEFDVEGDLKMHEIIE
jgi:hypothetical protein